MGDDDVDRVGREAGGERADEMAHAARRRPAPAGRRRSPSARPPGPPIAARGTAAGPPRPAPRPSREGTSTTPPSSGRRNDAATVTRPSSSSGATAWSRRSLSWLPDTTTTWAPDAGQGEQRARRRSARSRPWAPRCRTGRRPRARRRPARPSASAAISASTARCSSARLRPRSVLPTCQSPVWRNLTAAPRTDRARSPAARRSRPVAPAAGPASLARVAQAGNGNSTTSGTGSSGWATSIVPGLRIVARSRCARGQEAVLAPRRLGGVEAADDPDGRVGHDAPLDLAGRLLRADQDHAERPAPLGHVEQDLLDRAGPVPRRVLVELVEHHELQRAGLPGTSPCPRRPCAARRRRRSAWPGRSGCAGRRP